MKWQCNLIQRWLPEYPDGDLPAFWKRRLQNHLGHCAACQKELAELREVMAAFKGSPVAEPEPEFWTQFSRELHLKLAQANQRQERTKPAAPIWQSWLPYIVGVPVLALLAVWGGIHFTDLTKPSQERVPVHEAAAPQPAETPKVAKTPEPAEAPKVAAAPTPPVTPESLEGPDQFAYVTLYENSGSQDNDVDISGWDLDAELAGMTDQEKEAFLKKLNQHKRDGSCVKRHSWVSWA